MPTMQPIFHFTKAASKHDKFQVGSPLPKGLFYTNQCITLVNAKGTVISAHIKPIQLWPDLSIKWVNIEGALNICVDENEGLFLTNKQPTEALKRVDWVKQTNNQLVINTINGDVSLNVNEFIRASLAEQVNVIANIDIENHNSPQGAFITSKPTNVRTQYEVVFTSMQQPLLCKVKQTAEISLAQTQASSANPDLARMKAIKVYANIVVYYADTAILTNISVHNSNAIVHHNGQWDLGNEHSVKVKRLAITLAYTSTKQEVQLLANTEKQPISECFDTFELVQYSSGGQHWNSENHVASNNNVNLKHKGALGQLAFEGGIQKIHTNRPSPLINIQLNAKELSIYPQHFWQKYPTGIGSDNTQTIIDFADQRSECDVELQPGEIKSHNLGFSMGKANAINGLTINNNYVLNPENLEQSQANPFINKHLGQHPLMPAVNGQGDVNWLHKRELVDEFGWRNFGDLYADHEAAEHKGKGIFVSHYNNQYDPLFGFVKQWLLTQNSTFKVLAEDLFDHIIHIDIYHTKHDKPEYNQGLFWHTDHYVPAKTATHRTYSQHQETGVYMDHAGGGGPGAHHCYSSGLALYYLMTGDERAKQATLGLGQWMRNIYEGDGTLLGLILRAKNANNITLAFMNKLLPGKGTGIVRNLFTNEYPLDRGTGNYVNVLLDCFETTLQKSYFEQAQYVILNTISENDNINARNFEDVENSWYYVVFLQAVAKYLAIVGQQISVASSQFVNLHKVLAIHNAFIHYVNYMAKHEQHYLANTAILEYPNDTWTGQDLRKVHVLLCGYELTHNPQMLSKAKQLTDVVYPALLASKEVTYTRIQALIMQNYVSQESISGSFKDLQVILKQHSQHAAEQGSVTTLNINKSYLSRFVIFVKAYSIKNEIDMLCVRIPAVKKVLRR
ncbi:MAG: hypothetical protein ACI94Z_001963 [Yoonia sp.]|jgi:hypothetical protein